MKEKKKIFLEPVAEIIEFESDDVIATSAGLKEAQGNSDWTGEDGEIF